MAFQRALWHSGLTYKQTCSKCHTVIQYTDDQLDFRPWYADGFVYCPTCRSPLRHNEAYAVDENGNYIRTTPPGGVVAPGAPAGAYAPGTPVPPAAPYAPVAPVPAAPAPQDASAAPVSTDAPLAAGAVAFCKNCGRQYVVGDANFCNGCGNKLT